MTYQPAFNCNTAQEEIELRRKWQQQYRRYAPSARLRMYQRINRREIVRLMRQGS